MKATYFLNASAVLMVASYMPLGLAKPTPNPIETESGIAFVPFINLLVGYNDNLAKSHATGDESLFSILEPGIALQIEPQGNQTQLRYRLRNGQYFSSQQDNFTDHYLDAQSDFELNARHRLALEYNLALAHEGRGENDTTLGLAYNQYDSHTLNLGYGLGAKDAIGRIEANLGWQNYTYQNNRSITQYQDWDELRFNSTFYYQALPRTSVLAQVIAHARRYDVVALGSSSKDNNHYFAYLGASWDATGKLQGNAKLGYQQKDFAVASRKDFDSFSWDVDVTYLIRTYSALQLLTNRRSTDADGDGNAIDAATYQVNWSHNWNAQWTTQAAFMRVDEDYTASNRNDETSKASLRASYDFRRWLTVELSIGHEQKDSNIDVLSYSQNIYFLSIQGVI